MEPVQSVCHEGQPLKPIRSTAHLDKSPDWAACKEGPRLWKLPVDVVTEDNRSLYVDRACCHNEFISFRNRVAFEVPQPSKHGIKQLRDLFKMKARHLNLGVTSPINDPVRMGPIHPWSERAVLDYYGINTPKGKIYKEAYHELQFRPLNEKDARVNMFVKAEKLPIDSLEDPLTKDPRAIQFRAPVYSAQLAKYTLALEKTFYLTTPGATKGMDGAAKGRTLSDMISKYADPVFLELDCSRFDAHVSTQLLKCEHSFYNHVYSDAGLARMLRMQLINRGWTRTGMRYTVKGGRMSGDMNTALGNNVLQWGMINVWLKECGVNKFDFIFDGDDSVIVIESTVVDLISEDIYNKLFGMKAKLKVVRALSDIEYCKGHFFGEVGDLKFGRDPMVAILKDIYTTKLLVNNKQLSDYMYTLGLCMAHQYSRIPIMWKLANEIRAKYPSGSVAQSLIGEYNRGHAFKAEPPPLSYRSTLDSYGWSIAHQLRIEKSIKVRNL